MNNQLIKQQIQVHVVLFFPWQKSEGCHRGWHQHARWCAFGKCSVRRDWTPEVAVWCLVTWCHTGQPYGSRRCARVRKQDAKAIKTSSTILLKMDVKRHLCFPQQESSHHLGHAGAPEWCLQGGRRGWTRERPLPEGAWCHHISGHQSKGATTY